MIAPAVDRLRHAILIATEMLKKAERRDANDEFIMMLGLRVIDGVSNCCLILLNGRYTYIPVILRTVIEAIANIVYLKSDEDRLKSIINYNNRKMIKDIESLIRSNVGQEDQVRILIERIKLAKSENSNRDNAFEFKVSEIIKLFDDDLLQATYGTCARQSHNDLNEIVAVYCKEADSNFI